MGADRACGGYHVLPRRARPSEQQVFSHSAREEKGLLRHHRDGLAQVTHRDRPQVDAVESQPPDRGVVEARHEPRHRGLARSRLTYDSDDLPGRDAQVDVVQHRLVAIGERDLLESDRAFDLAHAHRCLGLRHGGRLLYDSGQLFQGRARGLKHVVELRQILHGLEELP